MKIKSRRPPISVTWPTNNAGTKTPERELLRHRVRFSLAVLSLYASLRYSLFLGFHHSGGSVMLFLVVATFVDLFATIFNGLIILRIIVSLFAKPTNRFNNALIGITEPVLAPVRRVLPKTGSLDLSPTVTVILLYVIDALVSSLLSSSY